MIHVATVHFGTARWVDIQLSYLRRNMHEPYMVWANLHDVPGDYSSRFDRTIPALGEHPGKLNLIAAEICAVSAPDDIIVFLDGDAFPVADPMPIVHRGLEETALVAIRRDENAGDPQPHPSFCAITVSEWQRLGGDWSLGHCWTTSDGVSATDVGGNMLRALERSGVHWTPLLRTNRVNVHPLWFGVYADVVYHHGSGFRKAVARIDLIERPRLSKRGRQLPVVGRPLRRLNRSKLLRWEARTAQAAEQLGEEMFAKLERDPMFYKELI
jgi:hypothetical protein